MIVTTTAAAAAAAVVPPMSSYFDECVFIDCSVFKQPNAGPVSVSNRADRFILEKLFGVPTTTSEACNSTDAATVVVVESPVYSLNPNDPYAKINIYSVNATHSRTLKTYPHTVMDVVETAVSAGGDIVPIDLVPATADGGKGLKTYTTNDKLTSFEMAVMLKYYSIQAAAASSAEDCGLRASLRVTDILYHNVAPWFRSDKRKWFSVDDVKKHIIIQIADTGELVSNDRVLNVPNSAFLRHYESPSM